jgi:very-short-patch-repair endonuclease
VFHANPTFFTENEKPNPFNDLTSKQIWDYDLRKKEVAESNEFKILYIWDTGLLKDKTMVIKKCLDFLKENNDV